MSVLMDVFVIASLILSILLTIQSAYTLYLMLYTWDRPDAYQKAKQPTLARQQLERVLKINPNYLPGRVHYGIGLYSAGRKADAVKTWEEVLEKNPGNRSAEMYLNLVREGHPPKGAES